MTYQQTLDYLFTKLPMYQRVGAAAYKADLNNTIAICKALGNPEKNIKCVHVAGTNGKGSSSHMLAAVLQQAGYKTGLYTSPHLVDFRERIKINGKEIPKTEVVKFVEENKTAFENVAFAMEVAGRSDEDIVTDVPYALELVGLSNKAYDFPHEMSGGEKQRLAIARAIINQPEVIIADEPTGNLDPVATNEVIGILKKINDLGTTVILTTHNKQVVDNLGKRVVHLENGRISKDDKVGIYPTHHTK